MTIIATFLTVAGMDEATFWSFLAAKDANGCRIWSGSQKPNAGGLIGWINVGGRRRGMHVHAFELSRCKRVPPGKVVRHSCARGACGEPSHLLLDSQRENCRDAIERDRVHGVKLADRPRIIEQVVAGTSVAKAARAFGVTVPVIYGIMKDAGYYLKKEWVKR